MKIAFLIRKMDIGGAQRQLVATAVGLKNAGHDVHVIALYTGGIFDSFLKDNKVNYYVVGKKNRWDVIFFLARLRSILLKINPDIIYSFMDIANISAVLLKPFKNPSKIAWGIRASNMDFSQYGAFSSLIYKLEALLSRHSDVIIANSNAGKINAVKNRFDKDKIIVIPNGINVNHFRPDCVKRFKFRYQLNIHDTDILIGVVGRMDPMKDHCTFIKAAKLVFTKQKKVKFIFIGGNDINKDYRKLIEKKVTLAGLDDIFIWTEQINDMCGILNSLDLSVSSSAFGEGFSNTIAESMSCGVPCVVTDVGDSALIVGNLGKIVPPQKPEYMAEAILEIINMSEEERNKIGRLGRERIVSEFNIDKLITKTLEVLSNC